MAEVEPVRTCLIEDADDPRIAPYISIRERDLTRGHGARFIVEGKVTLDALIRRSRFQIESLFLAEGRLSPLANLICEVPGSVPIYTARQDMMDKIAGFPVHRGVLACGLKGTPLPIAACLKEARTVLVLIGLSNHDNVGACFRNAAAFSADAVLLDETSCDPLYRKAIRVSAGTALALPFAQDGTGEQLIDILAAQGFAIWCLTPRADASPIHTLAIPEKRALVLGAEGSGLADAVINKGRPVRISMAEGFDSLNVATAGAIALSQVYSDDREDK